MVATVDELLQTIRSNPFIDGVGYFVELTTNEPVPAESVAALNTLIQQTFCAHSKVNQEDETVLGLDFHEHIPTRGEGSSEDLHHFEHLLRSIEAEFGITHLCIELQFDFLRAKQARKELDSLLKP